jgi:hypothetical protein
MKKSGIHTSNQHLVERLWKASGGAIECVRRTGEKRFVHPFIERPLRINARRHDVPAKLLSNLNCVSRKQLIQSGAALESIHLNAVSKIGPDENLETWEMIKEDSMSSEYVATEVSPPAQVTHCHRVRQRSNGSPVAGKMVSIVIPPFDWEAFKNTPNAQQFVKKAYIAEAKKQARIAAEKGVDSAPHIIRTMEEFLLIGVRFSADEIKEWLKTRDWSKAQFKKPEEGKKALEQYLPLVATDRGLDKLHLKWKSKAARDQVYGYVADIADHPDDPVADFIASSLDQQREVIQLSADDF